MEFEAGGPPLRRLEGPARGGRLFAPKAAVRVLDTRTVPDLRSDTSLERGRSRLAVVGDVLSPARRTYHGRTAVEHHVSPLPGSLCGPFLAKAARVRVHAGGAVLIHRRRLRQSLAANPLRLARGRRGWW